MKSAQKAMLLKYQKTENIAVVRETTKFSVYGAKWWRIYSQKHSRDHSLRRLSPPVNIATKLFIFIVLILVDCRGFPSPQQLFHKLHLAQYLYSHELSDF